MQKKHVLDYKIPKRIIDRAENLHACDEAIDWLREGRTWREFAECSYGREWIEWCVDYEPAHDLIPLDILKKMATVLSSDNYKFTVSPRGAITIRERGTTCRYKDGKLNGVQVNRFRSGSTDHITYRNDRRHGHRKRYHPNGVLQMECRFEVGEIHGVARHYGPRGRLLWEVTYRSGKVVKISVKKGRRLKTPLTGTQLQNFRYERLPHTY